MEKSFENFAHNLAALGKRHGAIQAGLAALLLLQLTGFAQASTAGAAVLLGIDTLLSTHIQLVAGKRIGLVTNSSAVDASGVQTLDRLARDGRVKLTQLYAPEHGLRLDHDNGVSDKNGVDSLTGIAVEGINSFLGPSAQSLKHVDVLVFDVQDIGSRTYTYATSLGKTMIAAARAHKPLLVLDRPNPGGGIVYEGPVIARQFRSIVGWGPLPVTHGLTFGELAQLYNGELHLHANLTVVPMSGWQRAMVWEQTGLKWTPTSSGIPYVKQAHLYVATGMICGAGVNADDGVGANHFFERIGARWADEQLLAKTLQQANLEGVTFEPLVYKPVWGHNRGATIHGVHLKLTDPQTFRPLHTALTAMVALRVAHPKQFKIENTARFLRIWGSQAMLDALNQGKNVAEIEQTWAADLAAYGQRRAKYLLYL